MYFQDSKKFEISVSTQSYSDKNLIKWDSVEYQRQSITVEEFAKLIRKDIAFAIVSRRMGYYLDCQRRKMQSFFPLIWCLLTLMTATLR